MTAIETFFSAWSMSDAAQRSETIAMAVADDVVYSDPRSDGVLTGQDALSEYVGNFSANAPGWSATVQKHDVVNGFERAIIAFGGPTPDGKVLTQLGTYFGQCNSEGKLTLIAGFVGTGAE